MAHTLTFEAIGTGWAIDIYKDISIEHLRNLEQKILERIAAFDVAYSRFRGDSLVVTMSKAAGEYQLPEDAQQMFELYQKLYKLTDGLMTPLIGKVMEDSGYDANYSLKEKSSLTQPLAWDDALQYPVEGDFTKIMLKQPVLLDVGAIGKGYLIDIVGSVLQAEGIDGFCIDAGGDILHKNEEHTSLKIGLENPHNFSEVVGVVNLENKALAGSAGSRRTWGRFHHIINPKTLTSVQDVVATWVVAKDGLHADGLATALFFVSPHKLESEFDFEYVIIKADNSSEKSAGFPGEVFIQ